MTTVLLLSIAAIIAVVFGKSDASTIDAGGPIDHKKLTIDAFLACGGALLLAFAVQACLDGLAWLHLLWIPMVYGVFTPIDRIVLNTSRKRPMMPLTHMGSNVRGPKESWYDGVFWRITRRQLNSLGDVPRVYSKTGKISPFAAAILCELSVLAASIAIFVV